jgi:hypothetical protein
MTSASALADVARALEPRLESDSRPRTPFGSAGFLRPASATSGAIAHELDPEAEAVWPTTRWTHDKIETSAGEAGRLVQQSMALARGWGRIVT